MVKQQLFIGAALIAGAAIGFCLAPKEDVKDASPVESESIKAVTIEDKGENASIEALRARLKSAQEELADLRAKANLPTNEVESVPPPSQAPRQDGYSHFKSMMEKIKQDDPERFKRITERMESFRRMREERQKAKLDFLSSVDLSGMGEEAIKNHEELKSLIVKRQELENELANEETSDDRRREVIEELFAIGGKSRELNMRERDNLLGAVAKAVGLEGSDATELVDAVKDIYESTEDMRMPHRGPRGRGRRD